MATTQLPEPGESSIEDHVQLSRWFLEHARIEIANENRIQASEKVWGAAAHALKAIAIQRGWCHRSHGNIFDIGEHLGKEFGLEAEFNRYLNTADAMHQNFYENNRTEDAISFAIDDVEKFVDKLNGLRMLPPCPFIVATETDRSRLGRLLGLRGSERPAIGDRSDVGFSQTHSNGGP